MELFLRSVFAPLFRKAGGLDRSTFNTIVRRIWWRAYCHEFPDIRVVGANVTVFAPFVVKFAREYTDIGGLNIESLASIATICWSRGSTVKTFKFARWKPCKRCGCNCVLAFGGHGLRLERNKAKDLIMQKTGRIVELENRVLDLEKKNANLQSALIKKTEDSTETRAYGFAKNSWASLGMDEQYRLRK
jgi:hypothetical protein